MPLFPSPEFLSAGLLPAFARTVGIIAFMPGISSPQVPFPVRAGLVLGICAAVAPALAGAAATAADIPLGQFGLVLLTEAVFGVVIGYGASLLMEAARLAGELIDLQIGLRAAELFDPIGATRSSLLGTFYSLIATLLFLQLDGHHWVLAGLHRSFLVAPVGCLIYRSALIPLVLNLWGTMCDLALRMGAPVMAVLLLTDLAFGLVVRAVPQVNILFVGMPAKIGLGLLGLALTASVFLAALTGLLGDLQTYVMEVLRLVK
jgi:flagellar biosynthetic protein FliR